MTIEDLSIGRPQCLKLKNSIPMMDDMLIIEWVFHAMY